MRERNGTRDREPETEAGGFVHIAGVVAAHERFEHDLLARIGNTGAIVLDLDGRGLRRYPQAYGGLRAVPDRVLDEIGDAAMQVVRTDRGHGVFGAVVGDLVSHIDE